LLRWTNSEIRFGMCSINDSRIFLKFITEDLNKFKPILLLYLFILYIIINHNILLLIIYYYFFTIILFIIIYNNK